ncbi:MucB/RseB C-terminal domain-containing protein [Salinimonas marina]|uniref:MucB/RseB C-terminal domain-containing protein n=1 Tax=Salinimonas marina TaxID=2785918 RepID=A0A7S9DZ02_9ALTE|nr:MucB/RseB C-terminal domain-containing protein [Salinimonas marina]QPG06518.1 MucB/RseB C-terminal domain-containing protein [Salinimonas marina]
MSSAANTHRLLPGCTFAHLSKRLAATVLLACVTVSAAYATPQTTSASQPNPSSQTGDEPGPTAKVADARSWLQKLAQMVATQNFHVAFVQARAGQETIPWLWRHGVMADGTVMEQLNLQNGPGQEQIRVGQVVSVFEPDVPPYSVRSGAIHGPIPAMLLNQPARLEQAYKFVTVGRARISGRTAQQLRIISRDNTRFSYQLWLDETTGMLLKLDTVDLQGNVLEQIQVTSFEVTDKPHDYFSKVNQSSLPQPMAGRRGQSQQHNWQVGFLPKGMVEVSQNVRRLALTGQAVEHKLFSDGLVDVSVYVQSAKQAIGSDLALRHDLNTFLTFTSGAAQVTVVGEIPLKTANAMAQSLTLSKENQ